MQAHVSTVFQTIVAIVPQDFRVLSVQVRTTETINQLKCKHGNVIVIQSKNIVLHVKENFIKNLLVGAAFKKSIYSS
jgi:putative heme iron utilization protein